MADTTGGEIPSLETSKSDAMCDSQSDAESTAATNGTSSTEPEVDSQQEQPSSVGLPSPSSTTVDSSVSSCSNSLDDAKKDDKSSPHSVGGGGGVSSQSSPFPSSFSVCSPLVSSGGGRSPLFAASRLSFAVGGGGAEPNSSSSQSPPSVAVPRLHLPSRPLLRPSQLLASPGSSSTSSSSGECTLTSSSTTPAPATKANSSPFVLKAPKLLSPFSAASSAAAKDSQKEEQNSAEAEPLCVPEKDTCAAVVSSNLQETCSSTDGVTSSSSPTRAPVVSSASSPPPPLPSQPSSSSSSSSTSGAALPPCTPSPMSFVPLSAPAAVASGGGSPHAATVASPQVATSAVAAATAAPSRTASQFVFGQNLHERVIVESSSLDTTASCASESASVSNNGEASCSSMSAATTNGTSEMLFSSVIQKELPDKSTENSVDDKNRKSLSEAAREYEESRAIKRKYEEVAVVTGEEEENNILQMDCKLFVYDNNKLNYSEGVHGMLRVNDPPNCGKKSPAHSSRVIVRMSGSLRVLLNTKIWADMKIEKPNRKIVRMTAMDTNGQIKIFLISSSPSESEMLFRVLDSRIKQQKEITINCQNGNGSKAEGDECTSSSPS